MNPWIARITVMAIIAVVGTKKVRTMLEARKDSMPSSGEKTCHCGTTFTDDGRTAIVVCPGHGCGELYFNEPSLPERTS